MAVEGMFFQFAMILLVAFVVSYIVRLFNQPVIVGYIFAGMIISPFILEFGGTSNEIINVFSKFGIAFLLFIVGLHLNPKVIKEIGIPSLFIGLVQMALTFVFGFVIIFYLAGWNLISSVYAGITLMFSSTIIVMKLLSDRGELDSFHGKISIGVLIIQDLVAIVLLIIISSTGIIHGSDSLSSFVIKSLICVIGRLFEEMSAAVIGFLAAISRSSTLSRP